MRLCGRVLIASILAVGCASTSRPPPLEEDAPPAPPQTEAPPPVETPVDPRRWIDLDIADDVIAARGCAVERGGALWCWGSRRPFLAGAGPGPSLVVGARDARAVAVGRSLLCYADDDGAVRCRFDDRHGWGEIAGVKNAVALEVGEQRGCALDERGELRCWELDGAATWIAGAVVDFDVGEHGGCALLSSGLLGCWRQAIHRGSPPGPFNERARVRARDIAIAGNRWLWMLEDDGRVLRADLASDEAELEWQEFGVVADGVELAAAHDHVCVRTAQGAALCRGHNTHGQLGDGASDRRDAFVTTADSGVSALALAELRTCALVADEVACAGLAREERSKPEQDPRAPLRQHTLPNLQARALAASGDTTCALDQAGAVRCWGLAAVNWMETPRDRLGIVAISTPTIVSEREDDLRGVWAQDQFIDWLDGQGRLRRSFWVLSDTARPPYLETKVPSGGVEAPLERLVGHSFACTTEVGTRAFACGVAHRQRAPVPGIKRATAVALGHREACAITPQRRVRCAYLPDLYEESAVVVSSALPGLKNAVDIASSARTFCALARDGGVRCWNARGKESFDARERLRLAIELSELEETKLTGVTALVGNALGFASLDADGRIRRWAPPFEGEVDEERAPKLEAAAVELIAGESHFCARDTNDAVTCWGAEDRGQLGRLPPEVHLELTPLEFPDPEAEAEAATRASSSL